MSEKPVAQLISWNEKMNTLCASAARISTTPGNSIEIFSSSAQKENNEELIKKVVMSGHQSIIEHAVFSIAFKNVSVFVEQYIIECRLASFTVKSRRYVDYGNQGYYIPAELNHEDEKTYCEYMDCLFEGYSHLLELGIAKEDARFLLPYSFCSNFYCTINARELVSLLRSIKYGRGKEYPELQDLADQLLKQLKEVFPPLLFLLQQESSDTCGSNKSMISHGYGEMVFVGPDEIGKVTLLEAPQHPKELLYQATCISRGNVDCPIEIRTIVNSMRPRELEMLNYTFLVNDISLASLTHLTRHRLQSIVIPSLTSVNPNNIVMPATIQNNTNAKKLYESTIKKAYQIKKRFISDSCFASYGYYFLLSGNTLSLITTMNARELLLFIRLRSCNRAQWEIREISKRMLDSLRSTFPELFSLFGPSCVIYGSCPEGSLSCGKMDEVISEFLGKV